MTETEKFLLRDIYIQDFQYSLELKEKLRSLNKKGKYNLFLFMHLGDDFIRLSVKKHFEKQYGKMHFIIQPNEVLLMKIFGIPKEDYTIFDFKSFLSMFITKNSKNPVIQEYVYFSIVENTVLSTPNTYEPFIFWTNNTCSCKEYEKKYGKVADVYSFIKATVGIITNEKINFENIRYPEIQKNLNKKLSTLGTCIEKIVLFLPEARSDEMIDKRIWEYLAEHINSMGYKIIENVMDENNHIEGCLNLKLNLLELTAVAVKCRAVFSLRSGLCDILASLGEKLYVFYTPQRLATCERLFSFEKLYDLRAGHYPINIVLQKKSKIKILFDGKDLGCCIPSSLIPHENKIYTNLKILVHLARERNIFYSLNIARKTLKEKIVVKMKSIMLRMQKTQNCERRDMYGMGGGNNTLQSRNRYADRLCLERAA